MQDFPANSQKAKTTEEPRQKLKPVTSAEARGRKRGLGSKFKNTFFSGSGRGALEVMVEDVVIPAIRDTLHDALQSGLDNLIYGNRSNRRPRPGGSFWSNANNPTYGQVNYPTNYQKMSSQPQSSPQRMLSRSARARHDFNDLIIPSRQEAEEVLEMLYEILSRHGSVSVADLYELTDVSSSHTDMKWGWTNLRGAKAVRLRTGGFLLDLPEPEALG